MSEVIETTLTKLRSEIADAQSALDAFDIDTLTERRAIGILARIARGLRYAAEGMTKNDEWMLMHQAEESTGFRCLEGLSESSVAELFCDRFQECPEMDELIADACSRVAHKWSGGEITDSAEEWAMDLVQEYARDRGVKLQER